METGPGTANWTSLEDISPYLVHAVLAHEDGGFFTHHGFSLRHIRDALVRNLKEGRYVVGASTITMQLVKNVFLHREKTLARKIQEVLLTWWIERVMEKRDIIELYLNVIEYGPSVYGIRNGAKHYFNRLPSQLSPAESVYLATILPNPKKYHSAFERGSISASWVSQMRQMLMRLKERGSYSQEATDYGLHEIEDFHFHPEGTVVPARTLPGGAAVLPYLQELSGQPGWGEDDAAFQPAPNKAPAAATAPGRPPATTQTAPTIPMAPGKLMQPRNPVPPARTAHP
jgi:membrane peptidoglycan carboxypeptidase